MTVPEMLITGRNPFERGAAMTAVAGMIAVLFAGSTVLTPLYIIYKQAFGFSQIALSLVYAVYVVGNLLALLLFGRVSDIVGRRPVALASMAMALISALVFLSAFNITSLDIARILSGFAVGVGAGTGTAWLGELIAQEDKSRAALIATSTNFLGLGVGALASGLLAEYAPFPLRLTFIVYLMALIGVALLIWRTRETRMSQPLAKISLKPRLAVPEQIRGPFIAPAVSGFGAMALVGFYAALAPSILAQQLHQMNHAVAGAIFFELAIVAAATVILTARLSSRTVMLRGLGLMIPTTVLIMAAQLLSSMTVMVMATASCGIASALGYRGGLQVVSQIAPEERRAEVVSAFFICCFCGNALPVIGIGILSTIVGAVAASLAFAVTIALFAAVALGFGLSMARRDA
jgi:MFS family permease